RRTTAGCSGTLAVRTALRSSKTPLLWSGRGWRRGRSRGGRERSRRGRPAGLRRTRDHVIDEAVLLGLLRGEPAVAIRVLGDLLERLARVLGDELGHLPLGGGEL